MHYQHTSRVSSPIDRVWAYHAAPDALPRLTPPWAPAQLVATPQALAVGGTVELKLKQAGVPVRWITEIVECDPPHRFVDEQTKGPFQHWRHEHSFRALDGETECTDAIDFSLIGPADGWVGRSLEPAFAWRHAKLASDLRTLDLLPSDLGEVLVTGASGLVGTDLRSLLAAANIPTSALSRSNGPRQWTPMEGVVAPGAMEGVDAVVHLAGAPIAGKRWTEERKQVLWKSRVDATRGLAEALAASPTPPRVLVCASAVGVFGAAGDAKLTEDSPAGEGFLADLANAWEAAAQPAIDAGIRVVHLRFGVILSGKSGALPEMLPVFRMGTGGPLGSGEQYFPWVHIDDVVRAICFAIGTDISGPVHVTAPEPVPQREFAKALGRALNRPAFVPAPAFAVRAMMGRELADALLLTGQRALPQRLLQLGFPFEHPQLDDALTHQLG